MLMCLSVAKYDNEQKSEYYLYNENLLNIDETTMTKYLRIRHPL